MQPRFRHSVGHAARNSTAPRRGSICARHLVIPQIPAGVAFVDGQFVPMAEARVPILDLGFLRSGSEVRRRGRSWYGKPSRLDQHLYRFFLGLDPCASACRSIARV